MSDPRVLSDRSRITSLALGILLGSLLGFATSLVFLLIIIGPLLGLGLAIAELRSGFDGRSRANVGGGLLIGIGSVYLLEALNTLNSCQGQDVCGGASALPFLGFAVVVLALGLLVEGITFAHDRYARRELK
jgi:hypothetical protein